MKGTHMATETKEPTLLQVAPSWARQQLEIIKPWILMMFVGLGLSFTSLPYPMVFALMLMFYRWQDHQDEQERLRQFEERIAWGMRRGNWQ